VPPPFKFDHRNPDYREVYAWRVERLTRIRKDAEQGGQLLAALKVFYAENPAQFIIDWGQTFDPRNADIGAPTWMPFILFPKQEEWVHWFMERWQRREPGITEKTRDFGMSWLTIATGATLCIFRPGIVAGYGSRKEDLVDKIGDPDSLFWKAREFVAALPKEFRAGWKREAHAAHMRMTFPDTGSVMKGEAGDGIGRGGRTSFYFVDEAAHIPRAELNEASLSANTNCRIDVSSVKGMTNTFAKKRHGGRINVITLGWRDDPRKDDAWYAKKKAELDPVVVAQEIDLDYSASVEGVVIPSAWVTAAVDAHKKLGIAITGSRNGALDVADEGKDKNAFAGRHGILVDLVDDWSGVGDDIFGTVEKAMAHCDDRGYTDFRYDADGLGAGVRGDARVINDRRKAQGRKAIEAVPFRGSAAPERPEFEMVPERKNKDFFANEKARAWWALRLRFQATFRAVTQGVMSDFDALISLDSTLPKLATLQVELSQPTYSINSAGKVVIDKAPDGAKSPNMADAVMILMGSDNARRRSFFG